MGNSCYGPRNIPDDPGLTGENLWTPLIRGQTKSMVQLQEQEIRKLSDSEWDRLTGNPVAMEEWMASLDELSIAEEKKFAKKNRDWYKALWTKYDANKDGQLSIEECRLMTRDALLNEKVLIPETTRQLVKRQAKIMIKAVRHTKLPPDTIAELEQKMLNSVAQSLDVEIAAAVAKYDEAIAMSDEIADQLWENMDQNHDGKVTKKEFLNYYVEASNNTIRFMEIVKVTGAEAQYTNPFWG